MSQEVYPEKVDLSSCEKEPIHIIGKSQSHGVIVACNRKDQKITQIGKNSEEFFGIPYQTLLGCPISHLVGEDISEGFKDSAIHDKRLEVHEIKLNNREFVVIPHFSGASIILDFEPIVDLRDPFKYQKQLSQILNILSSAGSTEDLCEDAAKITRNIFGYDRVMIYKFDEEWNGEVIAEEKTDELESWQGLHYPASDIPKQSRDLFMKHRIRIISDVNYSPVSIVPELSPINNQPLNLSRSELRGVSPIHIEYLQNMKVGASLTAALISNGKLWGLLACHHYSAKYINYYQRQTCDFLTQIFSNELTLKETNRYIEKLEEWENLKNLLVKQIDEEEEIEKGLLEHKILFTDLLDCEGGAVLINNKLRSIGKTPKSEEIMALVKGFLFQQQATVYFTNNLSKDYGPAANFKDTGSGILSIKLGHSNLDYLIWFRPQLIQNVNWGGNPDKKANFDEEKQRLTPRKSFRKWTQELTGVSDAWKDYQINAAKAIRESLNNIILEKQRRKIDLLNEELLRAHDELKLFSQGLSHDLKAPLRGIDGYAQILREDFYEELTKPGRQAIEAIQTSAGEMRELIDNILSFSGVSGQHLQKKNFSVDRLLKEILENININSSYPKTKVIIQKDIPKMTGDRRMLQQVWSNLIINALKYSEREEKPKIEIGSLNIKGKIYYYVRDNGIGFDPRFKEDIFQLFSRFSGNKFKGTGIGLAIVKKIIEKHNGSIYAESEKAKGATFYFHV